MQNKIEVRRQIIIKNNGLSLRQQCQLLQLNRGFMTYQPALPDDTQINNQLVDIYRDYPVYGYRRLTACLRRQGQGYKINSKRVLRLMREMGLKAFVLMSGRGQSNDNAHIVRLWRTLKYE